MVVIEGFIPPFFLFISLCEVKQGKKRQLYVSFFFPFSPFFAVIIIIVFCLFVCFALFFFV